MNKDRKTIIGALVILIVLLGIIGGLVEYHTAKISQVINESFSIISDNMSTERQKEIRLSQLDGYDNVQE
jgi:CHASE3 domain sensor protein